MNTTASGRLSEQQTAFFRDEGYLIFREPVFPAAEFDALKQHFEEKLAALPGHVRPEDMAVPHLVDTKLFRWLLSDHVLDLIEPILGPDIALWTSHFICKPKGNGKRVPWHEDSAYWGRRLAPMEVVTVWLAIDPSTRANGCMKVIPRTQHNGYSDYDPVDPARNVFGSEIKAGQRDESKAVYIELEPNQASLHESKLMHASDANTSTIRRCGYTMRYISTRTKLIESGIPHEQLYLARGKDRAGNTYGDPCRPYEELYANWAKLMRNGH